jgi:hypothetical protein
MQSHRHDARVGVQQMDQMQQSSTWLVWCVGVQQMQQSSTCLDALALNDELL